MVKLFSHFSRSLVSLCKTRMMRKLLYFFILLIMTMFSCQRNENRHNMLQNISDMMEEHPDSALSLLQQMNAAELNKADNALYCLLLFQAMDKNRIPLSSDSLITIAVNYFEDSDDFLRKALSFYYLGRYYESQDDAERATSLFLQAFDVMEKNPDNKLLILIYSHLGDVYYDRDWYDKSLEMQLKALEYSKKENNHNILYILRNIGRVYLIEEKKDSALFYYNRSLNYTDKTKDLVTYTETLNEISRLYCFFKEYAKALEYVTEVTSLSTGEDLYFCYSSKGYIYTGLGELDSAQFYLHKSLEFNNLYIKTAAYDNLYHIMKKRGKFKDAIAYNDLYILYFDSITIKQNRDAVIHIQQKYQNEKLKNEVNTLLISNRKRQFFLYIFLSGLVIVLFAGIIIYLQQRKRKQYEQMKIRLDMEKQEKEILKRETDMAVLEKKTADMREYLIKKVYAIRKIPSLNATSQTEVYDKKIKLSEADWNELAGMADALFDNFITRLKNEYQNLNDDDLQLCLLTKLQVSNEDIHNLFCITVDAVKKKKQRLGKDKLLLINKDLLLKDFIENF